MSKDIKVGDTVRITDGIGKGQSVLVQDLIELPFGTGVAVTLDGGYREMLNPANVEVISDDDPIYDPDGFDQREPSVFMPNADLIRRVKALEKQVSRLEAHLQGHEKNAHEAIKEKLSDLTTSQLKEQAFLSYHLEEIYGRLGMIAPNDPPNDNLTDVTTENVATRDYTQKVVDTPGYGERDARIDGPIGDAYARYDGDERVNGPDDFSAFADAVEVHARVLLRGELERFFSFSLGEDPS